MWNEIAAGFQSNNIFIVSVFIIGFISMIIVVERIIMLQFVYRINFKKFLDELRKIVEAKDYEKAKILCRSVSNTTLPLITLQTIDALEANPSTARHVFEENTLEFLPRIDKRIALIPSFAMIVLLLGVLGTIDSLRQSFSAADVLDTAQNQLSLTRGLSSSLNYTAASLLVGILILAFHQYIKSIAINLLDGLNYGLSVVEHLLVPEKTQVAVAAVASAEPEEVTDDELEDDDGEEEEEEEEDTFDDISITDIKDEEEII